MALDLFAVRSLLFLPASNPRAIEKARELPADLVILDLEDAVKPSDKDGARAAAAEAVAEPWPMPVAIRVNGAGTRWHEADIAVLSASNAQLAVLPRAETREDVERLAADLEKPVMAMIETPRGVLAAPDIAQASAALIAGTNDLRSAIGIETGPDRSAIATALQWTVLAARSAEIPAFDGVFNRLTDPNGFAAECAHGRKLGFDGKSLIHPDQIEPCNRAFSPGEAEIDRARRLLAAASGGAERFEDEMIERMHVEAAERLLARARA